MRYLNGPVAQAGDPPASSELVSGLEVFASYSVPDIGKSGTTYRGDAGDFLVVLPSDRAYIDSSVATEELSDEAWVVAISAEESGRKVICSRWQSKIFRSGVGDEADLSGIADGTLSSAEVTLGMEAGNLILDTDDPPEAFPDETWANLQIRFYGRRYDPLTKHSVNIVGFTCHDDDSTGIIPAPLADFEQPGVYDPAFLDNGLAGVAGFTTGGTTGGCKWIADDAGALDGSYSARTQIDETLECESFLRRTFTSVSGGTITFDYIHDNRGYGTRIPPFVELTNQPIVENVLSILMDGLNGPITIAGTHYDHSLIDNVNVPSGWDNTAPFFTTKRACSITIPAGTQTIDFILKRVYQDDGHLFSQIDNVQFTDELGGEDYDGYRRYYAIGSDIRKDDTWAWAKTNEETGDDLSVRSKTFTDFITLDGTGRILKGNPHYIVRLLRDGTVDQTFGGPRGDGFPETKGYVRFTASDNIVAPTTRCGDPDDRVSPSDGGTFTEPPLGSFQILPTGKDGFQVRGASGASRDATVYPVDKLLYNYKHPKTGLIKKEYFSELLTSTVTQGWPKTLNGWSIADNGTTFVPHLEILWRPTLQSPAWPESVWNVPPYRTDFDTSFADTAEWGFNTVRIRNPLFLPAESDKSRWALQNWVISRTYSDAWSRYPQNIWARNTNDLPLNPDDMPGDPFGNGPLFWWHPDYSMAYMAEQGQEGVGGGPWGSALWRLLQARFNPNGARWWTFAPSTGL